MNFLISFTDMLRIKYNEEAILCEELLSQGHVILSLDEIEFFY